MKKNLISEDSGAIETDLQIIEQSCFPAIEKIQKRYLQFNLGELTTDLLSDALFNNSAEIEKLFTKQAEMDTASVKNPVLKANLMNGIKEAIIDFRLSVNDIVALCDRNLLKLVTIEGNGPFLNDLNMEKLKESHRTYISEKEKELYGLHQKAASAMNDLYQAIEPGYPYLVFAGMFSLIDEQIVIREGVPYNDLLKK